jgi:hypothetical protein
VSPPRIPSPPHHLTSTHFPSPKRNLAILLCSPATPSILEEFHSTDRLQSTLLVSIWELGEVVGPLVVAPLCELYGRLPVYHVSNVLFIIFNVIAALSKNMEMLIAMRFWLGMSVASTVINPCIVGDMFPEKNRGNALSIMGVSDTPGAALASMNDELGGILKNCVSFSDRCTLLTVLCLCVVDNTLHRARSRTFYRRRCIRGVGVALDLLAHSHHRQPLTAALLRHVPGDVPGPHLRTQGLSPAQENRKPAPTLEVRFRERGPAEIENHVESDHATAQAAHLFSRSAASGRVCCGGDELVLCHYNFAP